MNSRVRRSGAWQFGMLSARWWKKSRTSPYGIAVDIRPLSEYTCEYLLTARG
jgi:hypothetical protein